jgi:hypothetical protein
LATRVAGLAAALSLRRRILRRPPLSRSRGVRWWPGNSRGSSDKGHGREFREFVKGAEPGCARAEDGSETLPKVACVNVLSGGHAAEHIVAVRMCCGPVVARRGCQLPPGSVERIWESDVDGTELDGDQVVRDGHVVPGQVRDVFDLLPEDGDKDCCCAVSGCEFGVVDDALDRFALGGGAEFRAYSAPVWGHSETRGAALVLMAHFRKRSAMPRVVAPSACQVSRWAC